MYIVYTSLLKGSLVYQVKWYNCGEKQYACLDMKLGSGITEEGGM
jgi:hypothetical protein